jgi:hypothetical protein
MTGTHASLHRWNEDTENGPPAQVAELTPSRGKHALKAQSPGAFIRLKSLQLSLVCGLLRLQGHCRVQKVKPICAIWFANRNMVGATRVSG